MKNTHLTYKIVLADDDWDDCDLFCEALEEIKIPHSLEIFHNGRQLLDHLVTKAGELPDILFLDLNMPLMDGREVVKAVRQHDWLHPLRLFILSTSNSQEDIEGLLGMGADGYIIKPPSFSELVGIVERILKINAKQTGLLFGRSPGGPDTRPL